MGNKQTKQQLETAQKTGIIKISFQRLTTYPRQLKNYPNILITLDLSQNRLKLIPDELRRFTILQNLNLSANNLVKLPDVVGELIKLEVLIVMDNFLVEIPTALSNCTYLRRVSFSNNQLKEFPTMLCGLKHLDFLDLSMNQIKVVPAEVGKLYATELNLNQNEVSTLSEEIASCPNLKILHLEENCLPASAFTPRILIESKICALTVYGNLFTPKEFKDLEGHEAYMERVAAMEKEKF